MIIFWIYLIKQNIVLKFISSVSFYFLNKASGKYEMTYVAHIKFYWIVLL